MESKPHLSTREIRILLTYGSIAAGAVVFFFLLGWFRAGAPLERAEAYRAEIAVLVPLTGESAESGKKIGYLVYESKKYFAAELGLDPWTIDVIVYDTGNTASSAAWAALLAVRDPKTVAIIGSLDARQVVAVQNTVQGKNLPVITISSTTPGLSTSYSGGVYRIPGTDDLQGPALVTFLRRKGYTDVFLIVESGDYTKKVLPAFTEASTNQLKFVGSVELDPANVLFDANQVLNSQARAIVYLGGTKGLNLILQGLQQTDQQIPIVGIDSINDPRLAPTLANGQELFFTSPIYVDANIRGPYINLPLEGTAGTYDLQAAQATWLVMEALSLSDRDGAGRKAVWDHLAGVTIQGVSGEKLEWVDGQLTPVSIYVYEGAAKESEWFRDPVDVFHPQ